MSGADIMDSLVNVGASSNVDKVFGKPLTIGEKTLIPIAKVCYGFGGGFGKSGPGGDDEPQPRGGQGGGGGGGASIKPIAILEVTAAGAKLIPIVDVTRVAVCGMLLVAWNIFWITRTIRALRGTK